MTEEQRLTASQLIKAFAMRRPVTEQGQKIIRDYLAEYDRMRQFIRNLADESRVYLESEE